MRRRNQTLNLVLITHANTASHGPVFNLQAMNPPKLSLVSSNQNQIMHQRDRSNLQIHRANDATSDFKIVAHRSITLRTTIIERERDDVHQCPRNILFPFRSIFVLFSTMHQLRTNRRASRQFFSPKISISLDQSKVFAFENFNPDIGIKQIKHHQVFAGDKGSSGGSSNSTSAQHPMMSARSGRLRFISSRLGGSSDPSTSEIASRTRDSSARAFSGSRRSKVRSNSIAIVLTCKPCHAATDISTLQISQP